MITVACRSPDNVTDPSIGTQTMPTNRANERLNESTDSRHTASPTTRSHALVIAPVPSSSPTSRSLARLSAARRTCTLAANNGCPLRANRPRSVDDAGPGASRVEARSRRPVAQAQGNGSELIKAVRPLPGGRVGPPPPLGDWDGSRRGAADFARVSHTDWAPRWLRNRDHALGQRALCKAHRSEDASNGFR